MVETVHHRLIGAKERVHRLQKSQRRKEELQKRLREQERLMMQHELTLEDEPQGVDKLMRMSLTSLFHTLLRGKNEQLKPDRRQALTAALKLQEARQLYADTEADLQQASDDMSYYRNAPREYADLMAEKETLLRTSPDFTYDLAEQDESIATASVQSKEIQEAIAAGRRVIGALEDTAATLGKVESWGDWELRGGGSMNGLKHTHIDDARSYIHNANHLMAVFQDELADVKRNASISIDLSGTMKLADYWFDGLIHDWISEARIQQADERLTEALNQVKASIQQLETGLTQSKSKLEELRKKRFSLVEQRELA